MYIWVYDADSGKTELARGVDNIVHSNLWIIKQKLMGCYDYIYI